MSKLNRSELKAIVKVCLLEILSEGLGTVSSAPSTVPNVREHRTTAPRRTPAFDPKLDTPVSAARFNSQLQESIKRNSGGNPILADMLADTAMTTLQEQVEPGAGGSHISQQEQFSGTPDEVFGDVAAPRADGSSHWADLAFMSKKSL
jgi:hypothetical protein